MRIDTCHSDLQKKSFTLARYLKVALLSRLLRMESISDFKIFQELKKQYLTTETIESQFFLEFPFVITSTFSVSTFPFGSLLPNSNER